jgi:putative zinc finger/helix-turn-helix YgiT family protein
MKKFAYCKHCGSDQIEVISYSERVQLGRRKVSVDGFLKTNCSQCGYEFVTSDQLDHNHDLIFNRSATTQGAVFPGLLRSIREGWGLTQRELSRLLGAGSSAVGKWESGAPLSGPASLLVQCAAHVPGTIEFLANMADVEIELNFKNESYDAEINFNVKEISNKYSKPYFQYRLADNEESYFVPDNHVTEKQLLAA